VTSAIILIRQNCSFAIDAILIDFQNTRGNYKIHILHSLSYSLGKKLKIHRMENAWTFIGNRMDFGYP
jgi:hypothetical protein